MSVHNQQTFICYGRVQFSQIMLQSLLKRQPRMVLQRVEETLPALEGSLGSVLCKTELYTGCPRRNVRDFGRVFLRSNYTDITQNTYIQSWTVTDIMAIEMCGLLGCRRTVRRPWFHTCPMCLPGNETVTLVSVLQSAAACGKVLGSLRTTMTRVRVFL